MDKKFTLKELAEYLDRLFFDDQFDQFDTPSALRFLADFGFLNKEKIKKEDENNDVD
jgi:hypothetical protein